MRYYLSGTHAPSMLNLLLFGIVLLACGMLFSAKLIDSKRRQCFKGYTHPVFAMRDLPPERRIRGQPSDRCEAQACFAWWSGVLSRGETRQLDEAARLHATGDFIRLPDGVVHYELQGEAGAQAVILVNGLIGPCSIWEPTFPALLEAGFRVLRYDLYGRGLSDRPDLPYTLDLFVRQLHELLKTLQIIQPVHLVGLSMGGPICAGFTARYPEQVRKLCLIDPAGLRAQRRLLLGLVRTPILGEIIVGLLAERLMRSAFSEEISQLEHFPQLFQGFQAQMQYRGFKRALLSTLRYGPIGDLSAIYGRIGEQGRPTLLIWGVRDQVVPFAHSQTALELMPQAEFCPIEQAGHIPHFEEPERINPLLIRFMKGE